MFILVTIGNETQGFVEDKVISKQRNTENEPTRKQIITYEVIFLGVSNVKEKSVIIYIQLQSNIFYLLS
jgi:hypothetical protein